MSLRRGFDRALFSPRHRDRSWLETQFGVPTEHFVIMYAGKLNSGKNVPMLCPMMEQAAEPRFRWHAHPFVLRREGQSARRAGGAARRHRDLALPREELAGAYAAAGLFVFPSMIDESGNAAVEALGSGLPALLAAGSGVASRMARCTAVRVLPGDCRQSWAQAIAELAAEPARCRGLGMLARDFIEAEVPSWDQIVDEDLLPVWRQAVAARWPGLEPHRLRRILILAPHPDDEIVACGIAARRARAEGAEIFVLFLTTGVAPRETLCPWQRSSYNRRVERKQEEAFAAMMQLGAQPAGFLDIPSRGLVASLDAAAAVLEQALRKTRAGELWVTAFEGAHQDHDAANALAANFRGRLPVWEFAAYNFAGGKVRSNLFPDARGGVVELGLSREQALLKRRMLAIYASERVNLRHIRVEQEAWRPLPRYDYLAPPHPGTLFRERFHWVPLRHPRIDSTPSAEICAALAAWSTRARLDTRSAAMGDGRNLA